jgi:hypothetical protein
MGLMRLYTPLYLWEWCRLDPFLDLRRDRFPSLSQNTKVNGAESSCLGPTFSLKGVNFTGLEDQE